MKMPRADCLSNLQWQTQEKGPVLQQDGAEFYLVLEALKAELHDPICT
jgi:hypothetical protein